MDASEEDEEEQVEDELKPTTESDTESESAPLIMKKNLQSDVLEKAVFTPSMKNLRKEVITVMKPTKDQRTILMTSLRKKKNLKRNRMNLNLHSHTDHLGSPNP
jgi:hypothetical protein